MTAEIKSVTRSVSVYSVYMTNVDPRVISAQRLVVERFLPDGWLFEQRLALRKGHADALRELRAANARDYTVFLDIDCVPLSGEALPYLVDLASGGTLAGAEQRANHLENGRHTYVGPSCMAFSNKRYAEAGFPPFAETSRGDVGEELTYRWEMNGWPVVRLRPTHIRYPLWDLEKGRRFGLGTTYGDLFYHEFQIRQNLSTEFFLRRCAGVMSRDTPWAAAR